VLDLVQQEKKKRRGIIYDFIPATFLGFFEG
jgi:hypothetical protein